MYCFRCRSTILLSTLEKTFKLSKMLQNSLLTIRQLRFGHNVALTRTRLYDTVSHGYNWTLIEISEYMQL